MIDNQIRETHIAPASVCKRIVIREDDMKHTIGCDINQQMGGDHKYCNCPCHIKHYPPILDVTCGARMMWFNKQNPSALYFDKRSVDFGKVQNSRNLAINPDIQGDFTNLPFPDCVFRLVIFDPPHYTKIGETGVLGRSYGKLFSDWECEIKKGFEECFRVLIPHGILIFKWCSVEIPLKRVLKLAPHEPLFGHNTGNKAQTHWMTFMKLPCSV